MRPPTARYAGRSIHRSGHTGVVKRSFITSEVFGIYSPQLAVDDGSDGPLVLLRAECGTGRRATASVATGVTHR